MIHQIFDVLRTELNTFLTAQSASNLEAKVEFMNEEPSDGIKFPSNCICPILIRIEEEKMLRQEDRYLRTKDQNNYLSSAPGIPVHLYIMFVARYKNYLEGLKNLSHVVRFFQSRPTFTNDLLSTIPELRIELHTPNPTALNEIWSMLRVPLHPSVIYRVSLLMLEADLPLQTGKVVKKGGSLLELKHIEE